MTTPLPPASMEIATQRLLDPAQDFDIPLLDSVISTAYDPSNPQRAAANKALMTLQESPRCVDESRCYFGKSIESADKIFWFTDFR